MGCLFFGFIFLFVPNFHLNYEPNQMVINRLPFIAWTVIQVVYGLLSQTNGKSNYDFYQSNVQFFKVILYSDK